MSTSPATLPRSSPSRAELAARVTAVLDEFLRDRAGELCQIGTELAPVTAAVRDFVLAGGKRLRPAFAYWGYRGAGGPDGEAVVRAAACLELLHAGALIHDDLMDGSRLRRAAPSVHRRFAALHAQTGWRGRAESFGAAGAILLGDLCLVWADAMLAGSGMPTEGLARAAGIYHEMRTELIAGQYLDVLAQATADAAPDRALRAARYKSGKYTVERPLHLGAVLAGADEAVLAAYTGYGVPLGEAFQLRDDLLGVFGDPAVTGKPAGDDLREGKRTVLVALARQQATPAQAATLDRLLGDPELTESGVAELRDVIAATGAVCAVEELITERTARALAALAAAPVDDEVRDTLRGLAVAATARRV